MSSERNGGVVVFHCDSCPDSFESESSDFNTALADAKADGWRAYLVGNDWCHACPACREDR